MAASVLLKTDSPLRALARQVRLLRRQLTILLPQNDYYVQKECAQALRSLGHNVVEVNLGAGGAVADVGRSLGLMLRACVDHRPDMLLTINYTGFDRAAWFDELVAAMQLPVAVWFVDSPFFLGIGYMPPDPKLTTFFCWDQSYVPVLRRLGATRTFHLPLAADCTVMAPPPRPPRVQLPLGFVGHTLDKLVQLWRGRDADNDAALPSAARWAEALLADRTVLHQLVDPVAAPLDARIVRLAHANYLASRTLRVDTLQKLPQRDLHVFGNAEWKGHLPGANVHPGCAYGAATAQIYASCAINLNVTNLQMPTAVNQRLFDVPAAGGFLLTDAQGEVAQLFVPDEEVVCFASDDALRDKMAYYGSRPAARAQIVAAARRRIAKEHTYVHRMQALVAIMRAQHGPQAKRSAPGGQRPNAGPAPRPSP